MPEMLKGAFVDRSATYRYSLWRIWNPQLPGVLFVMLNPSTADASNDDPTIRRCIGFAKSWGCGSLEVVNLFAYRATNPDELKKCEDPVGPENDDYIVRAVQNAHKVVTAWGTKGGLLGRNKAVMKMLDKYRPHCLDMTKDGHPKHPLYVAGKCEPFRYFGQRLFGENH
ncbi:MAG: hypothetical protein JWR03_1616 [Cohnella sp.]|nr:hypothetical protein [Cohnella sp.]